MNILENKAQSFLGIARVNLRNSRNYEDITDPF